MSRYNPYKRPTQKQTNDGNMRNSIGGGRYTTNMIGNTIRSSNAKNDRGFKTNLKSSAGRSLEKGEPFSDIALGQNNGVCIGDGTQVFTDKEGSSYFMPLGGIIYANSYRLTYAPTNEWIRFDLNWNQTAGPAPMDASRHQHTSQSTMPRYYNNETEIANRSGGGYNGHGAPAFKCSPESYYNQPSEGATYPTYSTPNYSPIDCTSYNSVYYGNDYPPNYGYTYEPSHFNLNWNQIANCIHQSILQSFTQTPMPRFRGSEQTGTEYAPEKRVNDISDIPPDSHQITYISDEEEQTQKSVHKIELPEMKEETVLDDSNEKDIQKKRCITCEEREVSTTIIPCGHCILCIKCSHRIFSEKKGTKCPKCRQAITKVMQIYH